MMEVVNANAIIEKVITVVFYNKKYLDNNLQRMTGNHAEFCGIVFQTRKQVQRL